MQSELLFQKLEKQFRPDECTEVFPKVGLQFGNTDTIEHVYTATFTGPQVFRALREKAARRCMLFTHHPVPQRPAPGAPPPALPEEDIAFMRDNEITLFSYHIPLDRNGPYSPGNSLARAMGATPYGEFYFQDNVYMGVLCHTPFATVSDVAAALQAAVGHAVKVYPYGDDALPNGQIAIMAGGASDASIYKELQSKGIHAFVTGMTSPAIDWLAPVHAEAQAHGVSLIGGTHYSTEKFAPMAMVSFFEKLGLPAEFLPEAPVMEEI